MGSHVTEGTPGKKSVNREQVILKSSEMLTRQVKICDAVKILTLIAVCCENRTERTNALYGQNAGFC
jgi:hypothetical protein